MTLQATRQVPLALLLLVITLALGLPGPAQAEQPFTLDLPAQPLDQAVTELARQTGIIIGGDASLLRGRQAPALKGDYTPEQALQQLLAGTGLTYRFSDGNTVTLVAQSGDGPVQLGPISVVGEAALQSELPKPYAGGQIARGGRVGVLGNKDFMDTPFSTTSATEQFARDVQAKDISDLLCYDASVQKDSFGVSPRVSVRGFYMAGEEAGVNGLCESALDLRNRAGRS